jgi:hypothetical protein
VGIPPTPSACRYIYEIAPFGDFAFFQILHRGFGRRWEVSFILWCVELIALFADSDLVCMQSSPANVVPVTLRCVYLILVDFMTTVMVPGAAQLHASRPFFYYGGRA